MILSKGYKSSILKIIRTLMIALIFFLVACGQARNSPLVNDQNLQTVEPRSTSTVFHSDSYPAYPSPGGASIGSYPAPSEGSITGSDQEAYPAATQMPLAVDQPRFQFLNELTAGMTLVEGSAPPNLSLAIIDVTYNGIVLGQGMSDSQGRFTISVTPLPEGNRVGIGLANLEAGKTYEQMLEELFPYRGDNYMMIPNVGVFFETARVQP